MFVVDIVSYVRQLLPPSYRDPSTVGYISVLFRPLAYLISQFNDFAYRTLYDIGSAGQVFVLQHVLRESVHPSITIADGNFSSFDFRVLVPPGLTNEETALLTSLLERYRLHSRRYDVAVQANWGPGGVVGGLEWVAGYPTLWEGDGGWSLSFGIRQTGVYYTTLKNETTGQVYMSGQVIYTGNSILSRWVDTAGVYTIRVGSLSATLVLDNTGTICDLRYDVPPTVDVEEIVAKLNINLYSARSNIGPFRTRIYNAGLGLLGEVEHTVSNGVVDIPRYEDGTYHVETLDRFGCKTARVAVTFGLPMAWVPGFPRVEDRIIYFSVTQSGIFPVIIKLIGAEIGVVNETRDLVAFQEDQSGVIAENGSYTVTVGDLEAVVTVTDAAVTCDLTWQDVKNPSLPSSLQYREGGGVSEVLGFLYSVRPGIGPFALLIYKAGQVVDTRQMATNNTWVEIASLSPGEYQARYTDAQGCQTSLRSFTVSAPNPTPLTINSVPVSRVEGSYLLTVSFSGGAGSKDISVVGEGGLIIAVTGVSVSPRTITLPAATPPQTVKVIVTDSAGSVEQNGIVLAPEVTGGYVPQLWSEGNQNYLKLEVSGTSENWLVSDISPYALPSGYDYYYYVGNKKVRQKAKLTNEPWQTNTPLHVMLCVVKTSTPTIVYWLFPMQYGGDWGDPNGGKVMGASDVGAYETYIFKRQ